MDSAQMAYRMNYLPVAMAKARAKVEALEKEALRYGMTELLVSHEQRGRL